MKTELSIQAGPATEVKPQNLAIQAGPSAMVAAKMPQMPKMPKVPKEDGFGKLQKRLDKLERGQYRSRIPAPSVSQQRAAPVTVTQGAPTVGMGGRGDGAKMLQIMKNKIAAATKKRKPKSPLTQLRKAYTAQRKVSFAAVNTRKKEKLAAYKKQIMSREGSAKDKRGVVATHRKQTHAKHTTWKKQFPPGSKIKDAAQLRSLTVRLKKETPF